MLAALYIVYIGLLLLSRMRCIWLSCAAVKVLHCRRLLQWLSLQHSSWAGQTTIILMTMTRTVIYITLWWEHYYNKTLLILSLAAVFLHVVAWRTHPQKQFIQSRADTFTSALGAFCADSLYSRNINNESYSVWEKFVQSHLFKKN